MTVGGVSTVNDTFKKKITKTRTIFIILLLPHTSLPPSSYLIHHSSIFLIPDIGTRYSLVWEMFCRQQNNKKTKCEQTPPFSLKMWSHCGSRMDRIWFAVEHGQNKSIPCSEQVSMIVHLTYEVFFAGLIRLLLLQRFFCK
jgi:hypothetical protein